MLKEVSPGKYIVKSHKGKNLSKPESKKKAKKRLAQVEYFKSISGG